jgi:ketosteroid isomerase-like protein
MAVIEGFTCPRRHAFLAMIVASAGLAVLAGCAAPAPGAPAMESAHPSAAELTRQVVETERAFAKTMAERNLAAFAGFLAEDAVFFMGSQPVRGRAAVTAAWRSYYEGTEPPFSWAPQTVEVLDSGALAISTGPVRDPSGKQVATFTSIWRLEAPGIWRIVFDKGNQTCNCAKAP